jgi:hypothetical protein
MRLLALLTLLAFSPSFANDSTAIDSLRTEIKTLSANQREIKKSCDCTSAKAIEKAEEFYNNSFEKIQNSYTRFLNFIAIFISVIGVGIAGFSYYNNKSATNLKNEAKKEILKIDSIQKGVREAKEELESQKINFKSSIDYMIRDIMDVYFSFAANYISEPKLTEINLKSHFINLGKYFRIATIHKIELDKPNDFLYYTQIEDFIDGYEENKVPDGFFLCSFEEFKKYCEEKNSEYYIKNTQKIWKKLFDKFGEKNILDAIKKYKSENFIWQGTDQDMDNPVSRYWPTFGAPRP